MLTIEFPPNASSGFKAAVMCRFFDLGLSGKSIAPVFKGARFTCPICGTLAQQSWFQLILFQGSVPGPNSGMMACVCSACNEKVIWRSETGEIIYPIPLSGLFPDPIDEISEITKGVERYNEARQVAAHSPRAAAALLRHLVEQIIVQKTGKEVKNLSQAVQEMALPGHLHKSMDLVRIVGNRAVHGGDIQPHEDPEVIVLLFEIVNQLVVHLISHPKRIEEMSAKLNAKKD